MSYRPDESILISWMYGELDEAETAKVEKYFQENPEELKKIQQLRGVSNIMSNIQDKEVIAPPLFMTDDETKTISFWKTNSFKTVMSIAASFLVLIVAAKLLNLNVSYSDNELRIAFGERAEKKAVEVHPVQTAAQGLTALEVQKMIDQSVNENLAASTSQVNEAVKKDIKSFVSTLQKENLAQMRDYLQLSALDQRKYTDNLLVEFSKYLNDQRAHEYNMYQTRFSKIEQNTEQLKSETEQILASIISSSPQIQQSSY